MMENTEGKKSDKTDTKDDKNKPDKKDKTDKNKSESYDAAAESPAAAAAVRPPRKLSRPKITLKMPPTTPQIPQFYNTPAGMVTIPLTPATGLPPNYPINVFQAYPNKAQEFMFKQFEGFKDFTKNTGKLGLSFGEKFAFWCYGKAKGLSTNSFTHIFLLVVICLYCAIGGIAFFFCENEERENIVKKLQLEDQYKLGNVTEKIYETAYINGTILLKNLTQHRKILMSQFSAEIKELQEHYHKQYQLDKLKEGWGLLNSMYFCGTIFTTIGYGHLAPVTTAGRIITIVYSIFGIPLFLILLADYGKLLTRAIKYLWAFVRRVYYTGSCRKVRKTAPVQEVVKGMQLVFDNVNNLRKSSNAKHESVVESDFQQPISPTDTPALSAYTIDDEFNLPISVAFAVLGLYMIGGAFLFSYLEGWNLFESFYFVYISTSTIGLGDFVPKGQVYVLLCSLVYFVFGLALTSMCINVVTEKLTDSFRAATAKIGATMGLEIAEEDAMAAIENPDLTKEEPT